MKVKNKRFFQWIAIAFIGVIAIFVSGLILGEQPVHALPEYTERTGESCSTCHVNPGGGGPRTLRGLLWAAQGRPDKIPQLGDLLIAPGVEDGVELYDIACAACHGLEGEGSFGVALTHRGLTENKIRSSILDGRKRSGMPGYAGQFTEDQLDTLVEYVTGIASGAIEPAPATYPLQAGQLECADTGDAKKCGGN